VDHLQVLQQSHQLAVGGVRVHQVVLEQEMVVREIRHQQAHHKEIQEDRVEIRVVEELEQQDLLIRVLVGQDHKEGVVDMEIGLIWLHLLTEN
jgi:hypothetical protein